MATDIILTVTQVYLLELTVTDSLFLRSQDELSVLTLPDSDGYRPSGGYTLWCTSLSVYISAVCGVGSNW